MNRTSIPTLIGVFTSLFVIWALHTFIVVDDCVEQGGSYQYSSGMCLLENGQLYDASLATLVVVLYFFVGFAVSLLVSATIRRLFSINKPK